MKTGLFRWILRCALYLIYLVFVLELATRLALWPDASFRRIVNFGRYYPDTSSDRLKWVRRHRTAETTDDRYSFDAWDPLVGWVIKPNIRNMTVFKRKVLNSNSRGVRGTTEYGGSLLAGRKKIMILGDSFTFGEDVSDDETYAHDLETMLPGAAVINFGIHGYGHDQMLLHFRRDGLQYRPDVVLLGFVWDDMARNILGFRDYWKPRFALRNRSLVLTNVPVPPPGDVLRREIYRPKLLDLSVILWHKIAYRSGRDEQESRALTEAILDQIAAASRQIGATFVIAYLPVWDEVANRSPAMLPNEQFLFQFCESRHISCVFLRSAFLASQAEGVDPSHGHWSPAEHRIAARALKDFLDKKGLTPSHN